MQRTRSAKATAIALVALCVISARAHADPVVELGTYTIQSGVASTAIQIFAYQDPSTGQYGSFQGVSPSFEIHDQSGHLAGPSGPQFTAGTPGQGDPRSTAYVGGVGSNGGIGADLVDGTIFGEFPNHILFSDAGLSNSQSIIELGIWTGGPYLPLGFVDNPSLIATVYISTVGVAPGTLWVLSIGGGQNGDPGIVNGPLYFMGDFVNDPNTSLVDGTISVVPEPSSVILAALGLIGLAAWGWRRKRA